MIVTLSVLAVFMGVIWYSYPREKAVQYDMAIPIIRADAQPIKTHPDDPGGMDIPFQDSTIFDAIQYKHATQSGRVENLLDESETPMSRAQVFAGLRTEMTHEIPERPAVVTQEIKPAEPVMAEPPAKTVIFVPRQKPSIATKANQIAPAAGNATRKIARTEHARHYIQLGSLRTKAGAATAWKGLVRRFPSVLTTLEYRVQEAHIKNRGTFYRLQAGPVDAQKARSICNDILKQKPGGCLVVNPR